VVRLAVFVGVRASVLDNSFGDLVVREAAPFNLTRALLWGTLPEVVRVKLKLLIGQTDHAIHGSGALTVSPACAGC
jgi:hypothetical protein